MTDFTPLLAAFLLGAALGLVHFYGLWLTVQRMCSARRPALWLLASGVARMALVLAGLYIVGHDDWRRMLAALAGIVLVRLLLTTRIGKLRHTALPPSDHGSRP